MVIPLHVLLDTSFDKQNANTSNKISTARIYHNTTNLVYQLPVKIVLKKENIFANLMMMMMMMMMIMMVVIIIATAPASPWALLEAWKDGDKL